MSDINDSPRPRTVLGRWMCAALLGRRESRDEFAAQINPGKSGWTGDESAVAAAACELALFRYFPPGYDLREVAEFASLVRAAYPQENLDLMQIEAVIRAALGEADVDVRGIPATTASKVHFMCVLGVMVRLKLDEPDLNRLVIEAEEIAFERGWHPPVTHF
jgi:hypothetical protein